MRRLALALAPLALLAGCGGGTGNNTGAEGNSSAPLTAVAPPAGKTWMEVVSQTPEGGFRMGNPDAPLRLVEYGSRTCPTCGAFGREGMQPLQQQFVSTGKVSYEFRDFMVHGAPDLAAALVGHCGGADPFFPFLEQMYIGQEETLNRLQKAQEVMARVQGQPPQVVATTLAEYLGYIDFAKQRGLPEEKVRACLKDQKAIDALVKMTEDASNSGKVTGTPTFFLNDEPMANVVSWSQMEAALKARGA